MESSTNGPLTPNTVTAHASPQIPTDPLASGWAPSGLTTMASGTQSPHWAPLPRDAALSPSASPSVLLPEGSTFHCSSRKCQLQELKYFLRGGQYLELVIYSVMVTKTQALLIVPLKLLISSLLLTLVKMASIPPGIMITSVRKEKEGTAAKPILASIKIDEEML